MWAPPPPYTWGWEDELKGNFKMSPFLAVHSRGTAQSALFPYLPFSPTVVFFFLTLPLSVCFRSKFWKLTVSLVLMFCLSEISSPCFK